MPVVLVQQLAHNPLAMLCFQSGIGGMTPEIANQVSVTKNYMDNLLRYIPQEVR